jgi:hypothetical protein
MDIDDQARWAIFQKSNGKCAHCRVRLKWEEFDIRGRSGGWLLEIDPASSAEAPSGQALCFKCVDFPGRKTSGRLYTRAGFSGGVEDGEPDKAS